MDYSTFKLEIKEQIAFLSMNNPQKANAMTRGFWTECRQVFNDLDRNPEVRVVLLSGESKHFSSGIDLSMFAEMQSKFSKNDCQARAREDLRIEILELQEAFTAIEKCRKPVIAAIHGACVGGGIDMISACDMRYCSEDAYFSVKEIDIGMVADVGTLQRLPKIIAPGIAAEWVFTGRKVSASEAREIGLVNRIFADHEALMKGAEEIALNIASKSPLSVRGIKEMMLYTRDHSVQEGLNYIATWNAAMLFSKDIQEALTAQMQKRAASFSN